MSEPLNLDPNPGHDPSPHRGHNPNPGANPGPNRGRNGYSIRISMKQRV
jgi:hypothetical protein